jgi:hypothetical protein
MVRAVTHELLEGIDIDEWRWFYADEIRFLPISACELLIEPLARVPRERFLGPGPWELGSLSWILGHPSLGKKRSQDRVDVCACSVQMRKVGIVGMEDKGEIGSSKKNCIQALALDESMCQ